ncbi:hypothetical protein EKO04_002867 [Ascochyta lentis]|uniref:Dolichol phosphate-mannose biosynthesis regulatory protein n=1 Tax=Ascochyta lentis TaxID=205686 RepID=A0A8H7J6E5_9PLEO|nr:hypothetical protein EKO04_002867 [Ascochyta lentis]
MSWHKPPLRAFPVLLRNAQAGAGAPHHVDTVQEQTDSRPHAPYPLASKMLDRLVGLSMLVAATAIFVYYTVWTLFMPFVDEDHVLHSLFLPRVWAIRIPVILIVLFTTVVGSFLSVVMIRSNRKKALKAQQKKAS